MAQVYVEEAGQSSPRGELLRTLMLPAVREDSDEALVVMRAAHYTAPQNLYVQLNDTPYVLPPAWLVEGGEDFDCARFRVVRA